MVKKNAIIFLGTNYLQVYALIQAKKLKFKIVGFDKNKNSPGKKYCDYFYNIDCNQISKIKKKLSIFGQSLKFNGVWSNNDILLLTKCKLEKHLKIDQPVTEEKICQNFLDKEKFKHLFNRKLLINNTKANKIKIIKPKIGSGSMGVKIIKDFKNFREKKNYVIEDYINGTEFGLNYFKDKKSFYILPRVKRYFDHKKHFVPLGTCSYKGNKVEYFDKFFENYLKKNKIYGPIKVDAIVGREKKIIELSSRFHGEIDTSHVFKHLNYPICKIFFNYLKNNQWKKFSKKDFIYVGYISFFKKKTNLSIIKKIFKKYNLKYLETINKKDSSFSITPNSTKNIMKYIFYNSRKEISISDFKNISDELNKYA